MSFEDIVHTGGRYGSVIIFPLSALRNLGLQQSDLL
jgi:hypothetical protein